MNQHFATFTKSQKSLIRSSYQLPHYKCRHQKEKPIPLLQKNQHRKKKRLHDQVMGIHVNVIRTHHRQEKKWLFGKKIKLERT